jgi:hypothetical protein
METQFRAEMPWRRGVAGAAAVVREDQSVYQANRLENAACRHFNFEGQGDYRGLEFRPLLSAELLAYLRDHVNLPRSFE